MAKRRKKRRKNPVQRAKNPSMLDGKSALALALVGAGIGGVSAAAAGRHAFAARTTIGAVMGGVLGAVMGALLPKGRSMNPEGIMGLNPSMHPIQNPVGAATALIAGTILAIVPAAVAIDAAAQMIPPPTVTGTYGIRKLHVVRKGGNWAWASDDIGGAALTRRGALEAALGELAPLSGPNDHVDLHFERPTITVEVAPMVGGPQWSWALSTGETGVSATRGAALIEALDAIDDFGEPL